MFCFGFVFCLLVQHVGNFYDLLQSFTISRVAIAKRTMIALCSIVPEVTA